MESKCPTCGSDVRIDGGTTKYYVPVAQDRIMGLETQITNNRLDLEWPVVKQLHAAQAEIDRLRGVLKIIGTDEGYNHIPCAGVFTDPWRDKVFFAHQTATEALAGQAGKVE
jgi:hypothetical protein